MRMSVDLLKPIPDMEEARAVKERYRNHPVDLNHPLSVEPLVPVSDYGVDGVSYYSQPNSVTGDPVEGVTPNIFVRRTVAEKLAAANEFLLAHNGIATLYDQRVGLYVRDGFRSPVLQAYLHDTHIPRLLREQNPEWSEEQIAERRKKVIAMPAWSETSMPPHFTGGAIDVIVVGADDGEILNTGFRHVTLGENAIFTDYLERIDAEAEGLALARYTRRILHNIMTTDKVGKIAMTGNPTETWHYSYGDQMWAIIEGREAAFYGVPPVIPDELQLDEIKTP